MFDSSAENLPAPCVRVYECAVHTLAHLVRVTSHGSCIYIVPSRSYGGRDRNERLGLFLLVDT